jgi:hypothetical protein
MYKNRVGADRAACMRSSLTRWIVSKRFLWRARAERYQHAPSNVQADFADPPLAAHAVVALDAARKDVYEAHADQRQIAEVERVRDCDYIEADFRRIREGRYTGYKMPDGCRSAADLRRALYERKLDDNPEGIESYKLRKTAGISRATQSRYRQQYHTITIPQHVDIPVSSVDDVVLGPRQTGELIAPDGTAIFIAGDTVGDDVGAFVADHLGVILRKSKPSMEKRSDAANEDEHNAYKRYSAQQRRRAGKGDQTGRDKPQRVTLRPSGYSQKWLERQLMYTPGVGDVPRYDPNTGEVFTAAQRWHMLGEGVMSTFTAHSEPREPEIPVTDPPIQPVEPEKPIKRAATPPWCRPALRPDIEVAPIDFQAIDDLCAMYRGAA